MDLKNKIKRSLYPAVFGLVVIAFSCNSERQDSMTVAEKSYTDMAFMQEYHEAYLVGNQPSDNDVRSIAVDKNNTIWIATGSGVFMKKENENQWKPVITDDNRGPAYSIICDKNSTTWMGTWNGVYRLSNIENNSSKTQAAPISRLEKIERVQPPISALCQVGDEIYALGPHGIWNYSNQQFHKTDYAIARSIRKAISDGKDGLWVATDVGLYHCYNDHVDLFQDTTQLISAYVKGIALNNSGQLWAGGLGGVSIRANNTMFKTLKPKDGVPSVFVNSIDKAPDGTMWVGSQVGVVRFEPDGSHSLRFSRRWLMNDEVHDVAFDQQGNAWIATASGVSAIKKRSMTLADKEAYFYGVLMRRHIRAPWIAGQCRLTIPGDTASWQPEDDDNDGEYTSNYLAMECFRYASTHEEDAHIKARKAFDFLKFLQAVTDTDGFFARTIVPADWTSVHDGNRTYSERELAEELVKDPRYKPVEKRWRLSKDGHWRWKGDTSSDEMCGHMMGYFFFYELAANDADKELISSHVRKIMDYLMAHNYNFVDVDGTPTRWAVWSPKQLNGDPEWASERSINSFELLAYLKFAFHITGDEKYQKAYRWLIDEKGYLKNIQSINHKNPAWYIFFDVTLDAYLYPILIKYEDDPELKKVYEDLMDEWFAINKAAESPLLNFIYDYARDKKAAIQPSVNFLIDTPLDLIDWHIDHTKREDIKLVRKPTLEDIQVNQLPPASIRATVRWDKNPWDAISGNPGMEREPVFWLLPYWMGRYLEIIK